MFCRTKASSSFLRFKCLIPLFWICSSCHGITIETDPPRPCTYHPDTIYHGILANCSNRNLTSVPNLRYENITTLLLGGNNIHHILGRPFQILSALKELDLSNNQDMKFYKYSFSGLKALEVLRLNSNGEVSDLDYPDESLSILSSLTSLYINGRQNDFGPGFSKLTNLKNLSLSTGECFMNRLKNSTFTNIPSVENLNISNCLIIDTEPMTFSPLVALHTIDASLNRNLGFSNFAKALYGLRGSSIKKLLLNRIYPLFGSCTQISVSDLLHLHETKLTHLYIDGNGITGLEPGAVSCLPRTLQYVSARENHFGFGIYMYEFILMPSIQFVDFSFLNAWKPIPFTEKSVQSTLGALRIPLPPKLETIVASNCYMRGVIRKSNFGKNSLRKIIADHNLLNAISGPIGGIEKIEYYDLSNNQLKSIQFGLFPPSNNVTHLNVSHNFLGNELEKDNNGSIFKNLINVKLLDIADNMIDSLPVNIFQWLESVETLNIQDNYLESFESRVEHLSHLKILNLARNRLKRLSKQTLTEIMDLKDVKINLIGNPLVCTCEELYFVHWMQENSKRIEDLDHLTCEFVNGSDVKMSNLINIHGLLESECQSAQENALFPHIIIIGSCCILIMCLVIIATSYRHRWKIRYFYHIARRRYWQQSRSRNCEVEQYAYDVFVSYAETDREIVVQEMISELEDKAGLKMCIHHRDFLPGDVIASSIVNAIDRSKKTLIILSPAFLKSDWCVYEYQIALQTRVSRRQNNLLILLYEHVPVQDLPRDMAVLLSTNCYLEYNPDVYGREAFWQNLVEAVEMVQPLE